MQCKHLLIIRVECTLTHNTRNLIKARDGEKTNYSGGSFSCVTSCINDEVYLPWDSFTANAKDGHLPRCKEVDWAGLQQVAEVMHLLCKVKRVLHIDRVGCWCITLFGVYRCNKHSLLAKVHVYSFSASLNLIPIAPLGQSARVQLFCFAQPHSYRVSALG